MVEPTPTPPPDSGEPDWQGLIDERVAQRPDLAVALRAAARAIGHLMHHAYVIGHSHGYAQGFDAAEYNDTSASAGVPDSQENPSNAD